MTIAFKSTLVFLAVISASVYAAELTTEQCSEFKRSGTIHLSEMHKKGLENSCKARFSDQNTLFNCIFYEADKIATDLKKSAKKECK